MSTTKIVDNTPVERPAEPLSEAMQLAEAQEAILNLVEANEAQPEVEEEQSVEETESQPIEEEDVSEDEAEVEESESDEDEEEYEASDNVDAEGEETEVYTIKLDGEEIEVTREELLQGYQRQSDYTKKTQGISEERKAIEEERSNLSAEMQSLYQQREQYQQALGQLGNQLLAGISRFQNVNWEQLKENDPIEYMTKRDEFREEQEKIKGLQQHQAQVQAQQQADMQKEQAKLAAAEMKKLAELIPEWKDPKVQPELAKSIRSYAMDSGYQKEEIDMLVDSRSVNVLMKAMKYDALQKADVKTKKLKNKPKMATSGSKRGKADAAKRRKAKLSDKLKQSGDARDAARLLEDIL